MCTMNEQKSRLQDRPDILNKFVYRIEREWIHRCASTRGDHLLSNEKGKKRSIYIINKFDHSYDLEWIKVR